MEIQRVKTEKSLSYGEARKLVVPPSSPSVTTSYASAARSATKKASVDCQTPAFWIGPQPSLLEASSLPSVQTISTGSGTHDTATTSSSISSKNSVRKSSPAKQKKQAPPKSQTKTQNNKELIKEKSRNIETSNKYVSLSSDLSEDMDTTQSPRPARSKSRSRSRTKNISPIKHQ